MKQKIYRIKYEGDYEPKCDIVCADNKASARKKFFINAKKQFALVKNITIEEFNDIKELIYEY